jgi:hypothetical protein
LLRRNFEGLVGEPGSDAGHERNQKEGFSDDEDVIVYTVFATAKGLIDFTRRQLKSPTSCSLREDCEALKGRKYKQGIEENLEL